MSSENLNALMSTHIAINPSCRFWNLNSKKHKTWYWKQKQWNQILTPKSSEQYSKINSKLKMLNFKFPKAKTIIFENRSNAMTIPKNQMSILRAMRIRNCYRNNKIVREPETKVLSANHITGILTMVIAR